MDPRGSLQQSSSSHRLFRDGFHANNFDPPIISGVYLVSEPVLHSGASVTTEPVLKYVRFETRSRDQGFISFETGQEDSYEDSHTWFEASILRKVRYDASVRQLEGKRFPTPEDARGYLEDQGWTFVKSRNNAADGSDIAWHVQTNAKGRPRFTDHAVEWGPGKDSLVRKGSGAGNGKGFVENLRAGDRIVLWARAQYPSWVNNVREASISIGYE